MRNKNYFPPFDSMKACHGAVGLSMKLLCQAKDNGCPAFRHSKVYLLSLTRWLWQRPGLLRGHVNAGVQARLDAQPANTEVPETPSKRKGKETALLEYPSASACSKATGIPLAEIEHAKAEGCPGFERSPKVELLSLLGWIFDGPEDESSEGDIDWNQELAKVKTMRERIRLAQDEGKVIAFDSVTHGLRVVMSILFGQLERAMSELPPALKGLDELGIKRRIEEMTDRLRTDLRAKFDDIAKGQPNAS